MSSPGKDQRPGAAWTRLLFAGVIFLLLAVLAVTTVQRISRTRELMLQSLTLQGTLIAQSLEGAARAGMRHGMWRQRLLQALTEEMADNSQVLSVAILGPGGSLLAASESVRGDRSTPLPGLPPAVVVAAKAGHPVNVFMGKELVVGQPFEPLRRWRKLHRRLPDWACELDQSQPAAMPMGRGMGRGMSPFGNSPPGPGAPPGPEPPQPPQPGYALVRLSTASFLEARDADLRQAFLLALLIFLAAGGAALGLAAYARKRDRDVARLRQEVAASEHLAAVGRLAASVAHEVRNPLSAIRGMVQFLAKGHQPGSRQEEYASVTISEVDRLERVVSGLLEYSRPRPPRRISLDLAESISRAVDLVADDPLAKGVEISTDLGGQIPPVSADPDQIRQVLMNLLLNALQALDGRGRVLVRAGAEDGSALVEVQDNGPGLPPGDPEQVFDPFFSTRQRGTGLGLAIARRIALAHGGDLQASAAPDGGALFTLRLPRAEATP